MRLHDLPILKRLEEYKEAKEYVKSEYPELCKTEQDTKKQAYDEAKQYIIEFGYMQ